MKKYIIALLVLFLLVANAAAQENGTNASKKMLTNISLDTGNNTGQLVYKELYYGVDASGNLTYETGRVFFDGSITSPRIRFQILRPLDRSGKPYPDNRIRAIATLDNKTILNGFYKVNKPKNTTSDVTVAEQPQQTGGKKSPGFGVAAGAAAVMLIYLYICRRRTK